MNFLREEQKKKEKKSFKFENDFKFETQKPQIKLTGSEIRIQTTERLTNENEII